MSAQDQRFPIHPFAVVVDKTRLARPEPLWGWRQLLIPLAVVAATAVAVFVKLAIDRAPRAPAAARGGEFALVSNWLTKEFSGTSWREHRWWPAIDCPELDARLLRDLERGRDAAQEALDAHVDLPALELASADLSDLSRFTIRALTREEKEVSLRAAELKLAAQRAVPPPRLCRLRYDSKLGRGAPEMHDDVFVIRGDTIEPLPPDLADTFRKRFPE
jgi:hypothetical protein